MSDVIEKKQITPRLRAVVSYDEFADNPRECCDPCTYLTFSSDKISADEASTLKWRTDVSHKLRPPKDEDGYDWNSRDEQYTAWEANLIKEFPDIVGLSVVSLYDHSGYALSLGESRGWDSGRVGFMFSTVARMRERHTKDWEPNEEGLKKLQEAMEAELEEYDSYINGNCYRGDLEFWNPAPDGGWEQVEDSTTTGYDTDSIMAALVEEAKSWADEKLDALVGEAQVEADKLEAEDRLIREIAVRYYNKLGRRSDVTEEWHEYAIDLVIKRIKLIHRNKGITLKLQELHDSSIDELYADVHIMEAYVYTGLWGAKCIQEPYWPKFAVYPRPSPIVKG